MASTLELLREGRTEELWQRCCGFIDLSIDEFMAIQRRLLLDEIQLLNNCELGNKVMRGAKPRSVEEFRQQVPITTYDDYVPYLPERREDALPAKAKFWQRTTGTRCSSGADYEFKWVPVTETMYEELGDMCTGLLLLASCRGRGDVVVKEHDKFFYGLAPPPYASGLWGRRGIEEGIYEFLPPLEEAEGMPFGDRMRLGFKMGLSEGIDHMMAIASVLVAVGERFGKRWGLRTGCSMALRHGQFWMLKAVVKSKLKGRPILPRDVWTLKGLASMGTDATVYREKIKELWGRYPLSIYGSTETVVIATQLWDYEGMTFLPHVNFWEFLPEDESLKWLADPSYQPNILTLDQVEAGQNYAIVVTNFYGGSIVRYFLGDLIKITSLRNENLNVDIPQMVFECRVDGLMDIAGFARLSETKIWKAIENSRLAYEDWTMRKREGEKPKLQLYLELKEGVASTEEQILTMIEEQLTKLDSGYADLESMLGLRPLEVTLLPRGAFRSYMLKQVAAGADLAHLKFPHMNPSDEQIDTLLSVTPHTSAGSPG